MSLEIIPTIERMRAAVANTRIAGKTIGLVPTMGALHAGHGSLIREARAGAGYLVVSVFVNPTQFDRRDDFEAYARDLDRDAAYCAELGADAVFAPRADQMYPGSSRTFVEVTGLQDHLCGAFRPGHFRGVATVVAKLFNIVTPDRAWFGEKDAQQLAIIRRMVADLNFPVEIVPVATVREADGLALSSRNQRLSGEERASAPALYRALECARRHFTESRSIEQARTRGLDCLAGIAAFRVEYFDFVDAESMQPVSSPVDRMLIAAAAWLGGTRLIDNVPCK